MALTDAQIAQISEKIFALRPPDKARLPKLTTTTGSASIAAKLDPVGQDARFKDISIGVLDFTASALHPSVWLHNENTPWRIGSTSKMAMMLAAVQLRTEVRLIKDLNIISTAQEFDDLYALKQLWKGSKINNITQIASRPPRISTIFDFTKSPIDFAGPSPDTPDRHGIRNRLPADGELSWATAPDFSFSERYFLTGALSDNVAATSCISEIGVPYIKAVLRAYGFFDDDEKKGMRFLLSEGFANHDFIRDPVSIKKGDRASASYDPLTDLRPLTDPEKHDVTDPNRFFGLRSSQSGSAAALTGFMFALMTDALADPGNTLSAGFQACSTIQANMANKDFGIESYLADGTHGIQAITTITKQLDKIGILSKADGEADFFDCEFVYLETQEASGKKMKYAVVALAVMDQKNGDLGQAIHKALLT